MERRMAFCGPAALGATVSLLVVTTASAGPIEAPGPARIALLGIFGKVDPSTRGAATVRLDANARLNVDISSDGGEQGVLDVWEAFVGATTTGGRSVRLGTSETLLDVELDGPKSKAFATRDAPLDLQGMRQDALAVGAELVSARRLGLVGAVLVTVRSTVPVVEFGRNDGVRLARILSRVSDRPYAVRVVSVSGTPELLATYLPTVGGGSPLAPANALGTLWIAPTYPTSMTFGPTRRATSRSGGAAGNARVRPNLAGMRSSRLVPGLGISRLFRF
jgi:hypothetical protein